MLSDEPFRLAPKPILFAGQRSNFRVRVFQRDMRLLEFLSQSRDLVAEGLFWAVKPVHIGYTPCLGGWRVRDQIAKQDYNQGLHVPVIVRTFP